MGVIVICDDDNKITEYIKEQIVSIFRRRQINMEIVTITNPVNAFEYCRKRQCDFILLDIDMPGMTGFELSERLQKLPARKVPVVIFMSNQENFVYEVFQYRPFDFLRKSHLTEELEKKLDRLLREYEYNSTVVELVSYEDGHILMKEVFYFKSDRNHVDAFTIDSNYRCRSKISEMEEKYKNCLIRTERSYLVNVSAIQRIGTTQVVLKDGRKVPLSRRRRDYVERRYKQLTRR